MTFKEKVRQAVADYMISEGCGCCENREDHRKAAARLAALLDVPGYSDNSGFNFFAYQSKDKP